MLVLAVQKLGFRVDVQNLEVTINSATHFCHASRVVSRSDSVLGKCDASARHTRRLGSVAGKLRSVSCEANSWDLRRKDNTCEEEDFVHDLFSLFLLIEACRSRLQSGRLESLSDQGLLSIQMRHQALLICGQTARLRKLTRAPR
ncbi:hypothetical protein D3C85_1339680 [compost metagenome]